MATTTVRLRGSTWANGAPGTLALTVPWGKGRRRIVLPWLPEEIERAGFARTWDQQVRPGRDPLLLDTGGNLRTHTMTVRVCDADFDQPVGEILDALIDAADAGKLATATLGSRWLGDVRITGLTVRETAMWDAAANPLDATVDLELTEAKDAPNAVGPVPAKPKGGKRPKRPMRPGEW